MDKITLLDILDIVEFGYVINNDGTLSLQDQLGANLGNIEEDKFEIDENLAINVVDRLTIYIEDYITDFYAEALREEFNEEAHKFDSYNDLYEKIKKYPNRFSNRDLMILQALDRPSKNIDISEVIKNSKITKKCFRCGHRLMKSEVEGYTYYCPECDEDFYEFEQNIKE